MSGKWMGTKNLRLYDPSSNTFSEARDMLVFISDKLSAHDRIAGMNTMLDFGLTLQVSKG